MDADLHQAHADLDERHWWFLGRRQIIAAVLGRHVPLQAGTVIDVGCGAGGLLSTLARHGRVVAVEGARGAADVAQARNRDAAVVHGEIPAALDGLPSAGLVTAFDVIEHLDDDVDVLRTMGDHLDPGGAVCVTVPALPWLWSDHDSANGHRRRYTAGTLRAALVAADLEVVHLSYFNTFLLPLICTARLSDRLRRSRGGDFERTAGPLDRLFRRILVSERGLVARWRMPIGVSLIAVARRQEPDEL